MRRGSFGGLAAAAALSLGGSRHTGLPHSDARAIARRQRAAERVAANRTARGDCGVGFSRTGKTAYIVSRTRGGVVGVPVLGAA